jgi:Protein of unknown function (DUF3237)
MLTIWRNIIHLHFYKKLKNNRRSIMSIELIPLATATLTVDAPLMLGTVSGGTRVIGEISDAHWVGDRLNARQLGHAAADWALLDTNGVGQLDIRCALKTDDGANIYVRYTGRMIQTETGPILYTTPIFETSDDRYNWLNSVQAVAKGTVNAEGFLIYEVYEVR